MAQNTIETFTIRRRGGFTKVPNSVLADTRLSIEARGLLAYIMSLPEGWVFRPKHLMQVCNVGKDKYYKIVREIKARGHLEVIRSKDARGRFIGNHWELHQEPRVTEIPDTETPQSGKSNDIERSDPLDKTDKTSNEPNHTSDGSKPSTSNRSAAASDLSGFFEEFWRAHPRPSNRSKSLSLFKSAVNEFCLEPSTLVQAAKLQAAKYQDEKTPRHYMNASVSWLDQRMWVEFAKKPAPTSTSELAEFYGARVKSGSYVHPGSIDHVVAKEMLRVGLASTEQLLVLGCDVDGEGG